MGLCWEPCGQTAPNRVPNIAQRLPEAQERSGWADAAPTAVFHVKRTLHTSAAAVPSSGLNRVLGGQNSLALKMQKGLWTCVPGQRAFSKGKGLFFLLREGEGWPQSRKELARAIGAGSDGGTKGGSSARDGLHPRERGWDVRLCQRPERAWA